MGKKNTLADQLEELKTSLIDTLTQKFKEEYDQRVELVLQENAYLREANAQLLARLDKLLQLHPSPTLPPDDTDGDSIASDFDSVAKDLASDVDSITSDSASFTDSVAFGDCDLPHEPAEARKSTINILILSDSMLRHVGIDCPKIKNYKGPLIKEFQFENRIFVRKVVVPGAKCDRLFAEAVLTANNDPTMYHEILLHVGSNYANSGVSPDETTTDILDCLDALGNLFPDSKITFSAIIPRFAGQLYHPTNLIFEDINWAIEKFCSLHGLNFFSVRTILDRARDIWKFYARDQTHLSRMGIEAVQLALRNYFMFTHIY